MVKKYPPVTVRKYEIFQRKNKYPIRYNIKEKPRLSAHEFKKLSILPTSLRIQFSNHSLFSNQNPNPLKNLQFGK